MQEQKIWHAGVLGMTLNVDEGRITIFRSTLETLGWPSHYRFLYNPQMNQIAVQVCSATDAGAHRVGKLNEFSSCEIKCVAFVRMVYKNAQWDKRRSYRMIGNLFPEQRLVSFQIQEALPIENGRVLDGTVSPHVCPVSGRRRSIAKQSHPGRKSRQWGNVRGVWRSKGRARH